MSLHKGRNMILRQGLFSVEKPLLFDIFNAVFNNHNGF